MRLPRPVWFRLPGAVRAWAIEHWMRQYASYQRFLAAKKAPCPFCGGATCEHRPPEEF